MTVAVTVDSPASTGIPPPTSMAALAANRGSGIPRSRLLGDPQHRPERTARERGVLLGLGAGVLEGRGPGPLEQGRRVGHLERDAVEAEGVAGGPGERLDEVADPLAVADEEPHALVRGVADDPAALPVPAGRDAHAGGAPVGRRRRRGRPTARSAVVTRSVAAASAPATSAASHWTRASSTTTSGTALAAPVPMTSTWSDMRVTVAAGRPRGGQRVRPTCR